MSEVTAKTEGLLERGLRILTGPGTAADTDLPESSLPPKPASTSGTSSFAVEGLFPASIFEKEIEAQTLPEIWDHELLRPSAFSRALEGALATFVRVRERHGNPEVVGRAADILRQELESRELAQMYRSALYQA